MTKTQWRILSKAPGARSYKFLAATWAGPTDRHERIIEGFGRMKAESPGWEFKIQKRTVTITTTKWS